MRSGEDQCLLAEGWQDVFKERGQDMWTWQQNVRNARYDRMYLQTSTSTKARCIQTQRLPNVWGKLSDHVPIRAVFTKVARSPPGPAGSRRSQGQNPLGSFSASCGASVEQSASHTTSISAVSTSATCGQKQPVSIIRIANAVDKASASFHELVRLCEEDPEQRGDLKEELLPLWQDVPVACGFRVKMPTENRVQRHATSADKLAQRQRYAKCKQWALQCGLSDKQFKQALEGCPHDFNKRGNASLHPCLISPHCSRWEHAKRICMGVAILKGAADAGRLLGDEKLSVAAGEEMSELMSSEVCRSSRCNALPRTWRSQCALNLPEDACKTLGCAQNAIIHSSDVNRARIQIGVQHGLQFILPYERIQFVHFLMFVAVVEPGQLFLLILLTA